VTQQQQTSVNAFRNTEAGRLMARLYNAPVTASSRINYPKPKKRNKHHNKSAITWSNEQQWRAVNSANTQCDPRRSEFDWGKARNVHVPSFRKKFKQPSKVDIIPKRKSAQECQENIQHHEMLREAYRPGNTSGFSTDAEKCRLNEIFAYKGGCALPEGLTNPVEAMTPSERIWREKEEKRLEQIRFKRQGNNFGGVNLENVQNSVSEEKDAKDLLFDQIMNEVRERREYQMELEELGAGADSRRDVAMEIASRISRLKQIDVSRANRFVSELYSTHP